MVFRDRFAALTMATDVTERLRVEHRNSIFSKLSHRLEFGHHGVGGGDDHLRGGRRAFQMGLILRSTFMMPGATRFFRCSTSRRLRASAWKSRVAAAQDGQCPHPARHRARRGIADRRPSRPRNNRRDHARAHPQRRARHRRCCFIQNHRPAFLHKARSGNAPDAGRPVQRRAGARPRRARQLRESEQRFRDLFENSPDAIFVEDFDGTVLDVNSAACALHGLTRGQLVGKNALDDLVPPSTATRRARDFQKLAAGKLSWASRAKADAPTAGVFRWKSAPAAWNTTANRRCCCTCATSPNGAPRKRRCKVRKFFSVPSGKIPWTECG
jgi:PAS domain S-box-containing protein